MFIAVKTNSLLGQGGTVKWSSVANAIDGFIINLA